MLRITYNARRFSVSKPNNDSSSCSYEALTAFLVVLRVFINQSFVNCMTRGFPEVFVDFLDMSMTMPRTLERDTKAFFLWLPGEARTKSSRNHLSITTL